ncbi:MAG: hypothetical protein ACSW8B_00580 [bacterium]
MQENATIRLYKRYVDVITLIKKDGQIRPLFLVWETHGFNQTYKIDKIKQIRKAASPVGGCGILYECLIEGHERHLFYEKDRWFIESYRP